MRRIVLLISAASLAVSCSSGGKRSAGRPDTKGELVSRESSKSFIAERPHGMVAIAGGSFIMGQADMDFTMTPEKSPLKTVTVSSFYMDETEVTNAQYRLFINYVRDSIARTLLAEAAGSGGGSTGGGENGGAPNYAYLSQKGGEENKSGYDKFIESQGGRNGYNESKRLDWSVPLEWNINSYPDAKYAEVLESMYVAPDKRVNNQRVIKSNFINKPFLR